VISSIVGAAVRVRARAQKTVVNYTKPADPPASRLQNLHSVFRSGYSGGEPGKYPVQRVKNDLRADLTFSQLYLKNAARR
jgi:hypothetical protein